MAKKEEKIITPTSFLKETGKSASLFGANFIKGFIGAHIAIPTTYRKCTKWDIDRNVKRLPISVSDEGYNAGATIPMMGNVLMGIYPICTYVYLFTNNHPYIATGALTAQITTNLVNLLYEKYRKLKNESAEGTHSIVPSAPTLSPLEEKVETTSQESVANPAYAVTKLENPWS